MKPVIDYINEFCKQNNENKSDVLFFALHDSLREANDPRMNIIDNAWKNKSQTLNAQECLAMRVDALQSKTQYKHQYFFLKEKSCNPLQPLSA